MTAMHALTATSRDLAPLASSVSLINPATSLLRPPLLVTLDSTLLQVRTTARMCLMDQHPMAQVAPPHAQALNTSIQPLPVAKVVAHLQSATVSLVFARLARSDTTLKSLLIMTLVSSARLASIVMLA